MNLNLGELNSMVSTLKVENDLVLGKFCKKNRLIKIFSFPISNMGGNNIYSIRINNYKTSIQNFEDKVEIHLKTASFPTFHSTHRIFSFSFDLKD